MFCSSLPGFALGCVCLCQGSDAPGLADLQRLNEDLGLIAPRLDTWLLRYILGGTQMPMPGVATREKRQQVGP